MVQKFIFKGELLQPCWAAVCIDGMDGIFTVLENGNIRICTDGKEGWCEGTPINDVFQKSWREYQVAVYPKITTEELALQIGVTSKTIKRRIAKMPHIVYVGSGYSGHWEVRKKE